jgi:very-short-patch-repair endonuclease
MLTDAERALWYRLRGGRLAGLKFRRQHPIPPYVVDFYCHDAALVVELDGSQHGAGVDSTRTAALERGGLLVLRLWDNDVLTNTDSAMSEILRIARNRTLIRRCAPPSPVGRREVQKERLT